MNPMKNILLVILLAASPAWAQTPLTPKPAPKGAARVVDNCAPIGRTAKGELVYSMKCDDLPAPPPPSQAEARRPRPLRSGTGSPARRDFRLVLRPPAIRRPGSKPIPLDYPLGLEWSLLPLIPAAMDMANPFSLAIREKRPMSQLIVRAGEFTFNARFEEQLAPKTVAAFRKAMPFESQAIHVRWSGEGVWMPLGDLDFGVSYENHTSYPAPGQIILYPGGISETEILLAYGGVHFASKMGQLAGNHFITLTSGLENLTAFGKTVLWKGAQKIRFEEV